MDRNTIMYLFEDKKPGKRSKEIIINLDNHVGLPMESQPIRGHGYGKAAIKYV